VCGCRTDEYLVGYNKSCCTTQWALSTTTTRLTNTNATVLVRHPHTLKSTSFQHNNTQCALTQEIRADVFPTDNEYTHTHPRTRTHPPPRTKQRYENNRNTERKASSGNTKQKPEKHSPAPLSRVMFLFVCVCGVWMWVFVCVC